MYDRSGYIGRGPEDTVTRILRQTNTITSPTSTFTFSPGYDVNFLDVYLNGSKLVVGSDFTALDGSTVNLTEPAQDGDTIEFVAYKAVTIVSTAGIIDTDLTVGGNITAGGNISGIGSAITGIVTSVIAGDNINVSSSTGSVTITGLANTANVRADTLEVTGVGTITTLYTTDATVANNFSATNANIAGNLSIGGTLTYEDVSNVDSVGIVTARSGVDVTGGTIKVGSGVTITPDGHIDAIGVITATSYRGDTSDVISGKWTLGANGSSDYTFTGPGLIGAENDPTIYVQRGMIYQFENTMGAHPFRIQSDSNGAPGTAYNDGITNNDVSNGILEWKVQMDAPDTLYYQCTAHANMGGEIKVGGGGGGGGASSVGITLFLT